MLSASNGGMCKQQTVGQDEKPSHASRRGGFRDYFFLRVVTNSGIPFALILLPLIVVSDVSPFSSNDQTPVAPSKSRIASAAFRMAARSFLPAVSMAFRATLAAS